MSQLIKHRQTISKVEQMNYSNRAVYRFGADKPAVCVTAFEKNCATKIN